MSLKNEKYKNKLENGRKKKFGKEFAEIPKGKHYVEELEPLIGAAVDLECDFRRLVFFEYIKISFMLALVTSR